MWLKSVKRIFTWQLENHMDLFGFWLDPNCRTAVIKEPDVKMKISSNFIRLNGIHHLRKLKDFIEALMFLIFNVVHLSLVLWMTSLLSQRKIEFDAFSVCFERYKNIMMTVMTTANGRQRNNMKKDVSVFDNSSEFFSSLLYFFFFNKRTFRHDFTVGAKQNCSDSWEIQTRMPKSESKRKYCLLYVILSLLSFVHFVVWCVLLELRSRMSMP